MKVDLHVHTKYSICSLMDPKKIIKVAVKKGLDGIAITDHNTMKGCKFFKNLDNFIVIPGEEIKTDKGEVIGLFLHDEIKPGTFDEVLDAIKSQDGLIVLPHPFDRFRGFKGKILTNKIHAIEVLNSRVVFQLDNLKALEFAENHKIPFTAGSDAHFYWEIGNAYINANVGELEEFRKAILNKKIEVTGRKSNPFNHAVTKVVKLWRKIKF